MFCKLWTRDYGGKIRPKTKVRSQKKQQSSNRHFCDLTSRLTSLAPLGTLLGFPLLVADLGGLLVTYGQDLVSFWTRAALHLLFPSLDQQPATIKDKPSRHHGASSGNITRGWGKASSATAPTTAPSRATRPSKPSCQAVRAGLLSLLIRFSLLH